MKLPRIGYRTVLDNNLRLSLSRHLKPLKNFLGRVKTDLKLLL